MAKAAGSWPRTHLFILLMPVLGIAFAWIAFANVSSVDAVNSDFFTFWLSGHLVTLGLNPYTSGIWLGAHHQLGATWITNATFIYPLPVALLFTPLGLLPLPQAYLVWGILSQFMILGSLRLLLKTHPSLLGGNFTLPLLAESAAFYPAILAVRNGQFSPFLLIVLALIVYLWEKERWWQGSLMLPLLALKPNLGMPIILLLSLYLVFRRQPRSLVAGAASGLLLIFLAWLQNHEWILQFWQAGNTKLSQIFGFAPTIWGVSAWACGYVPYCSVGLGASVLLVLLAACFGLLAAQRLTLSPLAAAGLAATITLLCTPTAWPYDQLLLLIAVVAIMLELARTGACFLAHALVLLGFDVLAFLLIELAVLVKMGIWNVLLPLCVLAVLIGCLVGKRSVAHSLAEA